MSDVTEIVRYICTMIVIVVMILAFCTDYFDNRGQ